MIFTIIETDIEKDNSLLSYFYGSLGELFSCIISYNMIDSFLGRVKSMTCSGLIILTFLLLIVKF